MIKLLKIQSEKKIYLLGDKAVEGPVEKKYLLGDKPVEGSVEKKYKKILAW